MKSSVVNSIIIAIMTSTVGIVSAITINRYINYKNGVINFTVNNQILNCERIEDIKGYIENNTVTLLDKIDISSCVKVEADVRQLYDISFIDYILLSNQDVTINTHITEIDLELLESLLLEYNKNHKVSENAYIDIDVEKDKYKVQEEKQGEQIDIKAILSDIRDNKEKISDINLDNYMIKPSVLTEDLRDFVDYANRYATWTVEYDSGQSFTCGVSNVKIQGDEIKLEKEFITDIIRQLESTYDTAGKGFTFIRNNGEELEILGGTYGNIMNSLVEKEFLIAQFEKGESLYNRTPIMKQELPKDIGSTYIEIDLKEQHLWFYENGELVSETDVVTGDAIKNRNTPTGVYFISEKINGKYLTGRDYKTWVNKWMRLTNSGVGLHDAGWRRSFGGDIYKGNGSHGCINLPKQYAYELFKQVYTKMPVIIY